MRLAMSVKYWYTIQIGVLNNDLRFLVLCYKYNLNRAIFFDPCIPLKVAQADTIESNNMIKKLW